MRHADAQHGLDHKQHGDAEDHGERNVALGVFQVLGDRDDKLNADEQPEGGRGQAEHAADAGHSRGGLLRGGDVLAGTQPEKAQDAHADQRKQQQADYDVLDAGKQVDAAVVDIAEQQQRRHADDRRRHHGQKGLIEHLPAHGQFDRSGKQVDHDISGNIGYNGHHRAETGKGVLPHTAVRLGHQGVQLGE